MNFLFFKKTIFGLYRLFYDITLSFITWIMPKDSKLILFAPFYKDLKNGNLWSLYDYINKNHPETEMVIVAKELSFYYDLKKQGFPVVLSGSWACFVATARVKYLLVDHNTGTVFWWGIFQALAKTRVIQVWHGTGFKQIVLMDEKDKPVGFLARLRYYDKILRCRGYDCIIASSDEDRERKIKSFQNKNVFITGYPKNDFLLSGQQSAYINYTGNSKVYSRVFLYAPTFRDRGGFKPFTTDFWVRLQDEMVREESLFLVKKHPQDQLLEVPTGYDRIKDISAKMPDLQKLLLGIDLLITDYSNIAVDFVLTGKPVVFYIFDYDDYIRECRTFYYDLLQTLPGPFAYEQEKLLSYILDQGWFLEQDYQDRYAGFKDRFHYYQDGNSCRRVVETCLR